MDLRKVLGTENPADLMTKYLARQPLDKCMLQLNQHRTSGHAKAGLDIQGKGKANVDPVPTPSGGTVATGQLSLSSSSHEARKLSIRAARRSAALR